MPGVPDVVERDPRAEGDRGEDRHLRRRVCAGHVLGRIGLGVSEPLRLGQRLGVVGAGLHLREDEVGRPVDDAEHAVHAREGERLAQHLDHRDRRAHARLEAELDAGRRRRREQLRAAAGDELLVGRDDRLPDTKEVEHVAAGRIEAAHHLGDERDRRVVRDRAEVAWSGSPGRAGTRARRPGRARARARRGADGRSRARSRRRSGRAAG